MAADNLSPSRAQGPNRCRSAVRGVKSSARTVTRLAGSSRTSARACTSRLFSRPLSIAQRYRSRSVTQRLLWMRCSSIRFRSRLVEACCQNGSLPLPKSWLSSELSWYASEYESTSGASSGFHCHRPPIPISA